MNIISSDNVTKQDLKNILDDRFHIFEEKIDKKTDEKFEEMARMVNKGFTSLTQGLDSVLEYLHTMNLKLNEINNNQKFFVSIRKHEDLKKRVVVLEQKIK